MRGGGEEARTSRLQGILLVLTVAREDRLYLTRRYERFFGGVAYVTGWPQSELTLAACERRGVACLDAADRGGQRTGAYARLFRDVAAGEAPWLRAAWPPPRPPPDGVAVAHMDFWLQPVPFLRRLDRGALGSGAFWTLAAGLNAPPLGPPPAFSQHLRVYGKGCLSVAAARDERDWTWGHGVRDLALGALARANATLAEGSYDRVCASQADLFHVPRAAFGHAANAFAAFADVSHEVAVPTVIRGAAAALGGLRVDFLDCWGCSQSWANDPSIVASHACGHKLDLRLATVRDAWRRLLDVQVAKLHHRHVVEQPALEAALAALDAEADARKTAMDAPPEAPPKPCCRDRTHGCCRLPGVKQTACACVARDPPRPPGNGSSACASPRLVRSRVAVPRGRRRAR